MDAKVFFLEKKRGVKGSVYYMQKDKEGYPIASGSLRWDGDLLVVKIYQYEQGKTDQTDSKNN